MSFKMQGTFTNAELLRYSKKFLCGLYIMTHGNMNNSVRSIDVFFKNVSAEAYERPSLGVQAANEIVLNLIQERLVERDTPQDIKLTLKGLEKCKNDCY
jgi:glucose-6-phosphate 1-dehydrogenase